MPTFQRIGGPCSEAVQRLRTFAIRIERRRDLPTEWRLRFEALGLKPEQV
jgi:hypothetical protein